MGLCLLGDRKPRKKHSVVWVCASWGTENHVKNESGMGLCLLGGPKAK